MNDRIKQGVKKKKGENDINLWPRKVEIDVGKKEEKEESKCVGGRVCIYIRYGTVT